MKQPKTIKGYLSILRKLESTGHTTLRDYDKLNPEQKQLIGFMSGEIGNILGEFKSENIKL